MNAPSPLRAALAATGLAAALHAQGGAVALYEVGTPDMGLSYAGAGARAHDASTAWTNPAGMLFLERNEALFGAYMLWIDQRLLLDAPGTVSVPPGSFEGGGQMGGLQAGVGNYVARRVTDDLWFGLSVNAPFAGGNEYDDTWVGRAYHVSSQFVALQFGPAIAWRATEQLSLGFGLHAYYAMLERKSKLSNDATAPLTKSEASDLGLGWSLSAMYAPTERTRLGLVYRAEVELEPEGDFFVDGGPTLPLETDLVVPQGINLSARHALDERTALLADFGWADWSAFSESVTTIGPTSLPLDRNWNDTWRLAIGAEHRLDERWLLTAGVSYDSSPVDPRDNLPDIPQSETWRISLGSEVQVSERAILGFALTWAERGEIDIDEVALPPDDAVVLDGEWESAHRLFVGLTLRWAL